MQNDATILDLMGFLQYFERVYERTLEVAQAMPPEMHSWRPRAGEMTTAEVIRHIGSTEVMNVRRLVEGTLRYDGHGEELGAPLDYLSRCHERARSWLEALDPARLSATLAGATGDIEARRVLLGMVEHEVHHRSQLCSYLSAFGLTPPPLFGIFIENLPR